jgi:hypothetical protein
MKGYYIAIMFLIFSVSLSAQNQVQAFRYSQVYPVGTARYAAMGGALGAVGGDFSAASANPAGLGLYRSSELTITPSFNINNSSANYLGETTTDSDYNFNIGSLGIVTAFDRNRDEGLVGSVFSFGYNALNSFQSSTMMQGINNNSSMLNDFTWYANNSNELDPFYEELAFETGLMPFDTVDNNYWHDLEPVNAIGYDGYGEEQVRIVEKRGFLGEYAFSYAVNISHKIYLGATFGIHSVRYYEDISHYEKNLSDKVVDFESFSFGEYNTTRGTGYAFKIGVIVKPIHILRIGATFHAPTSYNLTDEKFTDIKTQWTSNSGYEDGYESSGMYAKEYSLRTPYRASASAALLIGKLGIVSAEYEYVDYSSADLDSPGYNFIDENIAISKDFKNAHNLKAGAELRLNPLYLRAGAQYYMNPFEDSRNGSDIWIYGAGIGFRSNQTSIDISYSLRTSSETYGLYQHSPDQVDGFEKSINDYKAANIMLTMGYKF